MTSSAGARWVPAVLLALSILGPAPARAEKWISWGYPSGMSERVTIFFPGQGLIADDDGYRIFMRWDGAFVVETLDGSNLAWYANGGPTFGGYVVLQANGNLALFNWSDQIVWQSGTANRLGGAGTLYLQDDGNISLDGTWPPYGTWDNGQHWGYRTGPTTAWDALTSTDVYANTDSPGNDTRCFGIGAARASWCGYYCMQDNTSAKGSCAGWTYVSPGLRAPNPVCCLKSSIPVNSSDGQPVGWGKTAGMVTGIVW